jgi:hypothetical protein
MKSIDCFFWYPAFWFVLFPGFWLANRPEMVTSDWSDFLAVDWLTMEHIPIRFLFFFCQSKRPLCILSRLVTDSIYRGCINLSFFFLNFFFFFQLNTTRITFTAVHDTCLHSGASTDMVMSSSGLERYQAALDLHLSTSGIGRIPRRPNGMRGVVCHSYDNNDECPSVRLDSLPSRTR